MSDTPKCQVCGEPMPAGEEMFKYHGYSGPCPKLLLPRKQTEIERLTQELALKDADKIEELDRLESVLIRNGFVRCDIAACNCGSWHARFGLKERFEEIIDTLAEAGHPLCNENGHIVLTALKELVAEQDAAKAQVKMLVEALERLLNHYCKSTLDGAIDAVDNARDLCADSYALAKIKEEG